MELSLIFQIISNVSIILGIFFGILNLRNFQAMRKRESAILMLNSFQTMDFVRGLLLVLDLPTGIGKKEMDQLPDDEYLAIYMVIGTWERLGILIYQGEIDLDLFDNAYSGPVIQSWERLGKYITEFRTQLKRETAFEWFQWLAERMLERESGEDPIPAYVAHRNWKPKT